MAKLSEGLLSARARSLLPPRRRLVSLRLWLLSPGAAAALVALAAPVLLMTFAIMVLTQKYLLDRNAIKQLMVIFYTHIKP